MAGYEFKAFLSGLGDAAVPIGRKLALIALKPALGPKLEAMQLVWDDVVEEVRPVLDTIRTIKDLKAIWDEPLDFLEKLALPIARVEGEKALRRSGAFFGGKLNLMAPTPEVE